MKALHLSFARLQYAHLVAVTLVSVAGCVGTASTTTNPSVSPSPISVVVSPRTAAVQAGLTQAFSATVSNDAAGKGVAWTLSGSGCSASACGTLSASSSASGASLTYTAPATLPSPASVTLTATSVRDGTKFATATISLTAAPAVIAVSLSQTAATVPVNSSASFTATVANDPQNKGVTWVLSGTGCTGAACGALSSLSSATAVTYTAPANAPSPATVTLIATSVSDPTKSASATITVASLPAGISVSIAPTTATVAVNATATFTATVTGDPANKGVTWTLSGSECGGPSCGSLSVATSASGTPITYTAPGTVPSPPTVTVTATSVADPTKSMSATVTLTSVTAVNLGVGSFPSATVDSNGVIDIAWFTETGVVFARSQDQAVTFNTPAVAVPAPAFEPSLAVDGQGNIFILTGNNPTNSLGGNNVVVAHSTDGGKTFTSVTAEQNTYESRLLVQPSGVVELAYTNSDDNGEDPDNALHETRSADGGNTFTNDQTLWTAPINSSDIQQWQGALGPQGQIYYTWTEQVDINCEVHFVNSLDGVTFQPSVLLTNNDICNRDGALVVDPAGNIDAFWSGNGTNFVRSTDQGQTFTTPTTVPISGEPSELALGPSGALDSLAEDLPLGFTQSLDNGVTWSVPVSLGLSATPASFMGPQDAQIVVDPNGKITVVWRDDSNGAAAGDFDVYISTSTDGKNFTPATNISNTTGAFASAPSILISPQGLRYIYWYETSSANAADVNVFFYAGQ
jgi:hypothetical protein